MQPPAHTVLHRAAQYPAMAGKSYVQARADDSNTNLGWNPEDKTLRTHALNQKGLYLALNYVNFSLEWRDNNGPVDSLQLDGRSHAQVLAWLDQSSSRMSLGAYAFDLHFELPYGPMELSYVFRKPDAERLMELADLRGFGQQAMRKAAEELHLGLEPRVWPHHFDTGYLIELDEGRAIGVGMAIPDKLVDDFYFYVSGYQGHAYLDNSSLPESRLGTKYDDWWKGYATAVPRNELDRATTFLIDSIKAYRS